MTFTEENKGRCVAIFDIGTGSVSGALVYMSHQDKPRIVATHVHAINLNDEKSHSLGDIVREIAKGVDIVGSALVDTGLGAPTSIEAYLSSSWTTSETRTITLEKTKPFIVKESLIFDMLEREYRLFSEKERTVYQQVGDDIFRIDVEVTDTYANGYHVSELFNKQASHVALVTYMSVTSRSLVDVLNESFAKVFHRTSVRYRSQTLARFAVGRFLYPAIEKSIYVSIAERETEIMLISGTMMKKTITFPVGSQVLVDAVAEQFGVQDIEAEAYITLHLDNHFEKTHSERMIGSLSRALTTWLDLFQKALIIEGEYALIPEHIVLFAEGVCAPLFEQVIREDVFAQYRLTNSKFSVTCVDSKILRHFINTEPKAHPREMLRINAIFSTMLYQKK